MLFKKHVLDGIGEGRISLAFRRWTKPTVRAGGSLRTAIGSLAIESIEPVKPDEISGEDALRAGFATREAQNGKPSGREIGSPDVKNSEFCVSVKHKAKKHNKQTTDI